jgi:hypothetical protein
MKILRLLYLLPLAFLSTACETEEILDEPALVFRFKLDSTQVRLNNVGQPAQVPSNHRAQHPRFNKIALHYIELAPEPNTLLGTGAVIYQSPSTSAGGQEAIDFSKLPITTDGKNFLRIPFKNIPSGTYKWIRVSLAYQNYTVKFRVFVDAIQQHMQFNGTIASFIGYRQFITSVPVKDMSLNVNANKDQGFWGFETEIPNSTPQLTFGQAPPGATTVPNPLFNSSPIPQGSCVVTGPFENSLIIPQNPTEDIIIELRISVNNSFEWLETGNNDTFDPLDGDQVVDMGVRGLIPVVLPQ